MSRKTFCPKYLRFLFVIGEDRLGGAGDRQADKCRSIVVKRELSMKAK